MRWRSGSKQDSAVEEEQHRRARREREIIQIIEIREKRGTREK